MNNDIDVVIMWVDGNDKEWQNEILKYKQEINFERYRDWEILRYMFRGFEIYMPWIRKIHFVTCGHLPEWLNLKNSKINIVKHEEIMNKEDLPTFNSQAIEVNLYKIKGLSECFILFNDDIFVMKKLDKNRFFKNGKPCECAILNALTPNPLIKVLMNNLNIINMHFDKRKVLKKNFFKYFNYKCGIDGIRTICLLPWPKFTGFVDHHLANPFLKNTYVEVWKKEKKKLEATTSSKFRSDENVNQYLFRYWQFAKGIFKTINLKNNKVYDIKEIADVEKMLKELEKKEYELICINDSFKGKIEEFMEIKLLLKEYFEINFPKKSLFEK